LIVGTLVDAWHVPVMNVGLAGEEQVEGWSPPTPNKQNEVEFHIRSHAKWPPILLLSVAAW
jgi:hypothetical protein